MKNGDEQGINDYKTRRIFSEVFTQRRKDAKTLRRKEVFKRMKNPTSLPSLSFAPLCLSAFARYLRENSLLKFLRT